MGIFSRSVVKPIKREASSLSLRLRREILGIFLLTFGLLVFLSVWSFSPYDSSWFTYLESQTPPGEDASTVNLVGIVGATIAASLIWLVGAAALTVPLLIILQGIKSFQEETLHAKLRSFSGAVLIVICLSALFHLHASKFEVIGGGISGDWIAGMLEQLFAELGSTIILGAALLISILLLAPFSIARAIGQVPRIIVITWNTIPKISFSQFSLSEKVKKPKANKTVKINRGLGVRGGGLALFSKEEPQEDFGEILEAELEKSNCIVDKEESQTFKYNRRVAEGYHQPDPLTLLEPPAKSNAQQTDQILETQSRILTGTLKNFGIPGKVTEVHPGPVITMYEFEPGPGIKVARIVTLAHDLAMALKATSVRIVAPLPGKSTVGIEVPNPVRETVSLREVLTSEIYNRSRSKLTMALGKDIFGRPFVADLKTMPHLLVAGATGAGKSVGLNSMLLSLLFSAHPDEVKLLLIDPKVLELQVYDGIPHLLRPALTDPKAAARGLTWVVQEMERRYQLLAEHGVRNIQTYNMKIAKQKSVVHKKVGDAQNQQFNRSLEKKYDSPDELNRESEDPTIQGPLPYIVVVIDEFADLMMVAPKEVEEKIARLAQMARASGIHLILATQRPSVDVVTGLIKANFPARIAYQVSSKTDSRTILDSNGAESLLGLGDMLYLAPGTGRLIRLHGSYVSDEDVRNVVEYVKAQAGPDYCEENSFQNAEAFAEDQERDEIYEQAREVVLASGQASASLIQRRLRVGYPRAARMIEQMEDEGLVSAPGRDGRREVRGRRTALREGVR